ncbi:phosphopentomutase [Massiliimalia massiliensis]|uniref:phosphopentomutase n=1 Tax=Massiliimalia massiliensis TaxID=1852384 RepID=UPI0009874E52|nr:phosphopentomutase [Massiliimalia massiliensis]MBS1473583.1 phosphopentomutase [Massiliimalia sp.]
MAEKAKRIFLIVLDSVGIGEMPDAAQYGDEGSNTLAACAASGKLLVPNMIRLGLSEIDGVSLPSGGEVPAGSFARLEELSKGKDTTIGHWEIAGIVSPKPMPTYPNGFPKEVLDEFSRRTGRAVLCNRPYSGTKVIEDYGEEHMKTGALIVYTSADSVFQIAAHEAIVPIEQQYEYCEIAREILQGEHGVGRVIARPFIGEPGSFKRTSNRHDFSLKPPAETMLDRLGQAGLDTIGVGKIYDIFAGKGISETYRTTGNTNGMEVTRVLAEKDFHGLCFVNLVDFDMMYGHRNDVTGYTLALNEFDRWLGDFLPLMRRGDVLMITADHGCDPATPSTDHSREYTPLLIYGNQIPAGVNLGTKKGFCRIAATVCDLFGISPEGLGESLLPALQ